MANWAGLDPDMTIDEIMRRWPRTITVVLDHDLLCVGCPINDFHTVNDVCREHKIECARLMADLENAILRSGAGRPGAGHRQ